MRSSIPKIDVCICTYRRPALLHKLLDHLGQQETDQRFTYSIYIADNDRAESARAVVKDFPDVIYCLQPVQNIALARNLVVRQGTGDLVAFIDDDEFPSSKWLLTVFLARERFNSDGVLGPVLPHFEASAPEWLRKAGLYNFRKRYPTGHQLHWLESRTGNVLCKREALTEFSGPFREEFATGGEDQDFFRRSMERGRKYVWCDEAILHETIQPTLWKRRALLSRAMLRGKNSFKHREDRWPSFLRAIVAVPLYSLALPFSLLAGQHRFIKLATKLTAHLGFLLALVGLNPMSERSM